MGGGEGEARDPDGSAAGSGRADTDIRPAELQTAAFDAKRLPRGDSSPTFGKHEYEQASIDLTDTEVGFYLGGIEWVLDREYSARLPRSDDRASWRELFRPTCRTIAKTEAATNLLIEILNRRSSRDLTPYPRLETYTSDGPGRLRKYQPDRADTSTSCGFRSPSGLLHDQAMQLVTYQTFAPKGGMTFSRVEAKYGVYKGPL